MQNSTHPQQDLHNPEVNPWKFRSNDTADSAHHLKSGFTIMLHASCFTTTWRQPYTVASNLKSPTRTLIRLIDGYRIQISTLILVLSVSHATPVPLLMPPYPHMTHVIAICPNPPCWRLSATSTPHNQQSRHSPENPLKTMSAIDTVFLA